MNRNTINSTKTPFIVKLKNWYRDSVFSIKRQFEKHTFISFMILFFNIIPAVGVLLFNWSIITIFLIFWLELVSLGGLHLLRILFSHFAKLMFRILLIPVYVFLYLLFNFAGLNMIITFIFQEEYLALYQQKLLETFEKTGKAGNGIAETAAVFMDFITLEVGLALALIFTGDIITFIKKYKEGDEYKKMNVQKVLGLPFLHLVYIYLFFVFTGAVFRLSGDSLAVLAVLIPAKALIDIRNNDRDTLQTNAS